MAINPYANVYRGEVERERWIMHYSSSHRILIVGDGDFSFSLCLAQAFRSASNIVATSLDSCDMLMKKYKQAGSNVAKLTSMGAHVLHEVDATKMKNHTDLQKWKFDRIIFNFPHAGFWSKEDDCELIQMHKNIVDGFFKNASGMLQPYGEIHVNHKTTAPYCYWGLEELARQNSLLRIDCVDFKIKDYPGYNNKRGHGSRADDSFALKECSTYKFISTPMAKSNNIAQRRSTHALDIPVTFQPEETQMTFYGHCGELTMTHWTGQNFFSY